MNARTLDLASQANEASIAYRQAVEDHADLQARPKRARDNQIWRELEVAYAARQQAANRLADATDALTSHLVNLED